MPAMVTNGDLEITGIEAYRNDKKGGVQLVDLHDHKLHSRVIIF